MDLGSERKWGMGQRVHGGGEENKKKMSVKGRENVEVAGRDPGPAVGGRGNRAF